jgi:hypothetical protein
MEKQQTKDTSRPSFDDNKSSFKKLKRTSSCNLFLTIVMLGLLVMQYYVVHDVVKKIENFPSTLIYSKEAQKELKAALRVLSHDAQSLLSTIVKELKEEITSQLTQKIPYGVTLQKAKTSFDQMSLLEDVKNQFRRKNNQQVGNNEENVLSDIPIDETQTPDKLLREELDKSLSEELKKNWKLYGMKALKNAFFQGEKEETDSSIDEELEKNWKLSNLVQLHVRPLKNPFKLGVFEEEETESS